MSKHSVGGLDGGCTEVDGARSDVCLACIGTVVGNFRFWGIRESILVFKNSHRVKDPLVLCRDILENVFYFCRISGGDVGQVGDKLSIDIVLIQNPLGDTHLQLVPNLKRQRNKSFLPFQTL